MVVSFELVLGTTNRKKGEELAGLLGPWGIRCTTLADFGDAIDVVEDGDTFEANARVKATEQARHLGRWVLAEDSGLVVDALRGAPGIYSARYSGPDATDQQNNEKLLADLGDTPLERRSAHYVCTIAVADATGAIRAESAGRCHGRIRFAPAGTSGFGYDPLFEIVEYHHTFGELGPHVKAALSHRARAVGSLQTQLLALLQSGELS